MRRPSARAAAAAMAALAALAVVVGLAAPAVASAATGRTLCALRDPRITEASGIAVAEREPGVVFVQNDSGDSNRFFAVDERTCATVATVTVSGARNVDWEDIATARDSAGMPSVWLADIGDNDAMRHEIALYRVPEPALRASDRQRAVRTARAAVWRLRYPGGPRDAESLAVLPGGTAYVITKSVFGVSGVYRAPAAPDRSRVRLLRPAGTIRFAPDGVADRFGVAGELTATGASVSHDGTLLAVRTYTSAYVWALRGADVAAALRARPVRVALPRQRQGEGVAFSGRSLLVDSEGRHSAVDAVALGAAIRRVHTSASPPASTSDSSATSPAGSATTSPAPRRHLHSSVAGTAIGILFLLAIAGTAVLLRRRRGRRYRQRDDPAR
jgi:hypothetical protein